MKMSKYFSTKCFLMLDHNNWNGKWIAHNLLSLALVYSLLSIPACVTQPEEDTKDSSNIVPSVPNGLFPGNVGSYWKYKSYSYRNYLWHEDSTWEYQNFNSFHINFSDNSLIIRDSTKREISYSVVVQYGENLYKVSAYTNSSLTYKSSEQYAWFYWSGNDGIYKMGGTDGADSIVVKGLEIPFPVKKGDAWTGLHFYNNGSQFRSEPSVYQCCVADNEKLVTPLFTIDSCYVIFTRNHQAEDVAGYYDYYQYYAPNRGLVCQVVKSTSDSNSDWAIESVLLVYEQQIK